MKVKILEENDISRLEDEINKVVDIVKSSNIVDIVISDAISYCKGTKIHVVRAVIKHNGHI